MNKKIIYFVITIVLNTQSFNMLANTRFSSNLFNINNANNIMINGLCYITGINNISLGGGSVSVYADKITGQLGIKKSSLKYKTNIQQLGYINIIEKLTPVSFNYKNDYTKTKQIGLIAEEVDKANLKEIVIYGENGDPEGIHYELLSIILINEIKELKQRIKKLESILYQ